MDTSTSKLKGYGQRRDYNISHSHTLMRSGHKSNVRGMAGILQFGQMVPPNLPGTKKYWSKEYLDLAAFCQRQGVPDYFITLTANDSWPDLKNMLDGAPPHFRLAESILFFMQRFRAI